MIPAARPAVSGRVRVARDQLAAHLRLLVDQDGAVRGRCGCRGLESALALVLLDAERGSGRVRAEIAAFLDREPDGPGAEGFTRVVVRGALGRSTAAETGVLAGFLAELPPSASQRKRVMFGGIAALVGVVPFDPSAQLDDFACPGVHRWVHVELTALKVVYARALRRPDWITAADVGCLLSICESPGVWEGHVLAHLLILHALRALGGHQDVLDEGILRLLRVRGNEGGLPFISGMEVFCTAVTGVALAEAGSHPDVLVRMAAYLVEQQNPDGGWAYAADVALSDADSTAYSLELLHGAGKAGFTAAINAGESYLTGLVGDDGGLPTYVKGADAEVAMTAGAVSALAQTPGGRSPVVSAGIGFLLRRQASDGTFERSWSLSEANAMFRAVKALTGPASVHAPELHQPIRQALDRSWNRLHQTQNTDGGWGHRPGHNSDPISTAYSLAALSREGDSPSLRTGTAYMIGRQRPDGGFSSIPDGAGPRPIPYDVPVLANCYALLALSAVTRIVS